MLKITVLLASLFVTLTIGGCTVEHHEHRPARVVEYHRVERAVAHHDYHGGHREHGGYYRRSDDCR